METPGLPEEMRAGLPAAVVDYITYLESRLARLEAQLRQHSGNSSRPPSQDPPTAPLRPAKAPSGRRAGGQPGHPGHRRELLPVSQVDEVIVHRPSVCGHCGGAAEAPAVGAIRRQQVWELPAVRPRVTEHQYPSVCCGACQRLVAPERPTAEEAGAFGPRVAALVALLHGRFRLSARETAAVLADCFGVPMGLGSVPAACAEVGDALAGPYTAVQASVAAGERANVDETGWKQGGKRRWLWTAVGVLGTLFLVSASRGAKTLTALLGDAFAGIVGSDRFSAYRSLPLERRQVCWAHLKRNLAAFATWGGETGRWGKDAGVLVDRLFATWHQFRDDQLDRAGVQAAMDLVQTEMRALLDRGSDLSPPRALCQDMLALWPALWTFVTVEGIEPTNNAAERALRPAVLWRKGCFGAASDTGNVFVERILTVSATCRQHERHLLSYLTAAVSAHRAGFPAPALLPTP